MNFRTSIRVIGPRSYTQAVGFYFSQQTIKLNIDYTPMPSQRHCCEGSVLYWLTSYVRTTDDQQLGYFVIDTSSLTIILYLSIEPYLFNAVAIRNDVIRHVDGAIHIL